jgi:hypothetical protein
MCTSLVNILDWFLEGMPADSQTLAKVPRPLKEAGSTMMSAMRSCLEAQAEVSKLIYH